jgi:uncharacterized protein (TIGR03382 family)
MTVDLPARLLADQLTWALAVACAVALEAMLARHPGLPPGPGIAVGGLLLVWQWRRRRHRPVRLSIGPGGVDVRLADASASLRATGPRARVLGRSVVLHWRGGDGAGTMWLTPFDVPRDALRATRVRIQAARATVAG